MSMKEVKNAEIRAMIAKSGLKIYQLADYLGIGNTYLSRIMSRKLSKANEIRIVNAINEITDCTFSLNDSRWIPCKELLPADGQTVLFTYIDGFDDGSKTFRMIEIGSYDRNQKKWSGAGFLDWQEVIAWMPLPEPYEGD